MSTEKEVAEATRFYFETVARVKAQRKLLAEDLKEARNRLEELSEELGQENLFSKKDPRQGFQND